jgi:hypothetical protein
MRPRLSIFILIMLAMTGPALASASAVQARGVVGARSSPATAPALGPMTVLPSVAHIGQTITITGRTTGHVSFLPPFVLLQSAQTVTIKFGPGFCFGTARQPAASATVIIGGGSGRKGSRQNPPAGSSWRVHFRVPATMTRFRGDYSIVTVPTPPGKYYISAIAAGMDGPCGLVTKGDAYWTVATITIVR